MVASFCIEAEYIKKRDLLASCLEIRYDIMERKYDPKLRGHNESFDIHLIEDKTFEK